MKKVLVLGAGLAGSQAALWLARRNFNVTIWEQKPLNFSSPYRLKTAAELVCSNSLRGKSIYTAAGLLKEELKLLDSDLIKIAFETQVKAGGALAVDRRLFSNKVTEKILNNKNINVISKKVLDLSFNFFEELLKEFDFVIVALGPVLDEKILETFKWATNGFHHFYDAVAPIIDAETIDFSKGFWADKHNAQADYFNIPLTEEEYKKIYELLLNLPKVKLQEIEKNMFFDGCMPVEEIAKRGYLTLKCGPFNANRLIDPKTGKKVFAVIQLRRENNLDSAFSLVGFQTKLTFKAQEELIRNIPGLENAKIVRYGVVHRNSYINAPLVLNYSLNLKKDKRIFVVGQLGGMEGYIEAIATGLIAAFEIDFFVRKGKFVKFPDETMLGGIQNWLSKENKNFVPVNVNFSLIPPLNKKIRDKRERNKEKAERALESLNDFILNLG